MYDLQGDQKSEKKFVSLEKKFKKTQNGQKSHQIWWLKVSPQSPSLDSSVSKENDAKEGRSQARS